MRIGLFERFLSVWVALCIVAGIVLGQAAPALVRGVAALEVAGVNLAVGALVWVSMLRKSGAPRPAQCG